MQYDLDHIQLTSLSQEFLPLFFEINDTISLLVTTTRITHGHLSLTISTTRVFIGAIKERSGLSVVMAS
jgi:hypothetical protein